MDAKRFYRLYKAELQEGRTINGQRLFDAYRSNPGFTEVVTDIIKKIIEREGYTPQTEYFRIDVCGWISHNEQMNAAREGTNARLHSHLWDLKIAVEHENNPDDWSDEVIKLVHIKCPLKVIIGYTHCDERETVEKANLDLIARCMQQTKAFETGTNEEYLIILGNAGSRGKGGPDYTEFNYIGYFYNWETGSFVRIEDCNNPR